MMGLTHDLGKLLLLSHFPEEMEHILWVDEEGRSDREIAAFGMDHAGVGSGFAGCLVPRALAVAVQTHHAVMLTNAPARCSTPGRRHCTCRSPAHARGPRCAWHRSTRNAQAHPRRSAAIHTRTEQLWSVSSSHINGAAARPGEPLRGPPPSGTNPRPSGVKLRQYGGVWIPAGRPFCSREFSASGLD
jgi:hypothetical protein